MPKLNLTREEGLRGRLHYKKYAGNGTLTYCYIRKNACTSFKAFFNETSAEAHQPGEDGLAFMNRAHRATAQEAAAATYRICVLRDPVKRCASLFKNKFISRNGNVSIFDNYRKVTGEAPEQATFNDFIDKYLAKGVDTLDPHAWAQKSHLLPIEYNHAFLMEDLYENMLPILGERLAKRYFAKPTNSSTAKTRYDDPVGDHPSDELHRVFVKEHKVPSDAALFSPGCIETIQAFYRNDIDILRRLES